MKSKKPVQFQEQGRLFCQRWTAPRDEIFRLLVKKSRQHLTAKEIYVLLQPTDREIGIATVYRTLDLLDKAGLLRKVQYPGSQVRYQYKQDSQAARQYHLICTACSKVLNDLDFEKAELDLLGKTEDLLEQRSGFLIQSHNIEYSGLCKKCRPDATGDRQSQGCRASGVKRSAAEPNEEPILSNEIP